MIGELAGAVIRGASLLAARAWLSAAVFREMLSQ